MNRLSTVRVAVIAHDMKNFSIHEVAKIADCVAFVFGEQARERVVATMLSMINS